MCEKEKQDLVLIVNELKELAKKCNFKVKTAYVDDSIIPPSHFNNKDIVEIAGSNRLLNEIDCVVVK